MRKPLVTYELIRHANELEVYMSSKDVERRAMRWNEKQRSAVARLLVLLRDAARYLVYEYTTTTDPRHAAENLRHVHTLLQHMKRFTGLVKRKTFGTLLGRTIEADIRRGIQGFIRSTVRVTASIVSTAWQVHVHAAIMLISGQAILYLLWPIYSLSRYCNHTWVGAVIKAFEIFNALCLGRGTNGAIMSFAIVTVMTQWVVSSPAIRTFFAGFSALVNEVATEKTKAYIESKASELPRGVLSSSALSLITHGLFGIQAIAVLCLVMRHWEAISLVFRATDNLSTFLAKPWIVVPLRKFNDWMEGHMKVAEVQKALCNPQTLFNTKFHGWARTLSDWRDTYDDHYHGLLHDMNTCIDFRRANRNGTVDHELDDELDADVVPNFKGKDQYMDQKCITTEQWFLANHHEIANPDAKEGILLVTDHADKYKYMFSRMTRLNLFRENKEKFDTYVDEQIRRFKDFFTKHTMFGVVAVCTIILAAVMILNKRLDDVEFDGYMKSLTTIKPRRELTEFDWVTIEQSMQDIFQCLDRDNLSACDRVADTSERAAVPSADSSRAFCSALTNTGQPCKLTARVGSKYCTRHG